MSQHPVDWMKRYRIVALTCIALSFALAACGGSSAPSVSAPEKQNRTLQLDFAPGDAVEHRLPFGISGGVPPFTSHIDGCPDWVTLFPDQGMLAGTAPAGEHGRTFFCTYLITDSGIFGPNKRSYGLRLTVTSLDAGRLSLPSPARLSLTVGSYHGAACRLLPEALGPTPIPSPAPGGSCRPGWASRPRPACSPAPRTPASAIPAPYRNGQFTACNDGLEGHRGRGVRPRGHPSRFLLRQSSA